VNWNDLKFYLTVARVNNITEASKKLQVSPSTVARRISELEKELSISLFNKRPNGYFQSEFGTKIFAMTEDIESRIYSIERKLENHDSSRSHVVKIDVPELLGPLVIIPQLKSLQQEEPNIRFEFTNSVINSKLSTRSNDIVVRFGRPDSGSYKLKTIGIVSRGLYCSEEYVSDHGTPETPADLANHFLIGWDKEMEHLPIAKWFSDIVMGNKIWMKTSSLNSQLEAVVAGLGISALPKFVATKYNLTRVLPNIPPLNTEIFLMKNTETASDESVSILAAYVENCIRHQEDIFLIN